MSRLPLPENADVATKYIDEETKRRKIDRGIIGYVVGSGDEKPGNMTIFVLIFSALLLISVGKMELYSDFPRKEIILMLSSLIPGAIGYYFGTVSAKKSD